jgi:hypothetical protein
MNTDADWLARLPLIGPLPPGEAAEKLREVGEPQGVYLPGMRDPPRGRL